MKNAELRLALDEIRATLGDLAARVRALETASGAPASPVAAGTPETVRGPVNPPDVPQGITDEIVMAIAAAVAAFLGERAHVRQIRLISSSAWAQQGRVWVQASHRLDR